METVDTRTPLYKIPTYTRSTDQWSYTHLYSIQEFREFLIPLFKEPGEYNISLEISREFNKIGRSFRTKLYYTDAAYGTREFKEYWDTEKEKCKEGVIYIDDNETFYLPREYYMWLNFLPIFNKEANDFTFPLVYDTQLHVALYEKLAELHYEHSVILKKRQIAMSYYHAAKLINLFFFEKGVTLKLLASLDSYINEEGTWMFISEYRDFLNEHTAWYRPCEPDKVKNWQQKIQVEINGRKTYRGNKSRLLGISTQQSPTKGVGGASRLAVFEEAGIGPTMDKTYRYMKPALESGLITTGMFVAYGSVGDLHQCEPLKKFMFYPKENGFYAVETNLVDDKGTIAKMGLFIPEQWSMPPYIDEAGNSQVKEALTALLLKRVELKATLSAEDYQLEISQHPINIAEAFDWRTEPIFPTQHVSQQIKRIEDGEYASQYIDLDEDKTGTVFSALSKKRPLTIFPVPKKTPNKEGVLVVFERPDPNAPWGMYTASIDPVKEGKTLTSESLCSIIIYKNPTIRIKHLADGTKQPKMEGDKIVATWCGRYDDIKQTHKQLELIIRWYNAWTLCEVNVAEFVTHMITRNLQHFLVPKDQILFLKELTGNNGYHDYGWKNTGAMFKNNLLPYGINFLGEEIDHELDVEGTVTRIHYGVQRIPDVMILKEMKDYRHGMNADRLVAFCALVAFVKIQYAARGAMEIHDRAKKLENPQKKIKLIVTPFRNIGNTKTPVNPIYQVKRSAFRNYK